MPLSVHFASPLYSATLWPLRLDDLLNVIWIHAEVRFDPFRREPCFYSIVGQRFRRYPGSVGGQKRCRKRASSV